VGQSAHLGAAPHDKDIHAIRPALRCMIFAPSRGHPATAWRCDEYKGRWLWRNQGQPVMGAAARLPGRQVIELVRVLAPAPADPASPHVVPHGGSRSL
jgi:hypothetical protein